MKGTKAARCLFSILGILFMLTVLPFSGHADVPQTIDYQGYLTDPGGNPVDASRQMTFSIYATDDPAVTDALWRETQTVAVNNGVYNVILGSQLPVDLPFDIPYYLGIKVETDVEMIPRQVLTSVPYAFNADKVDGRHAGDFAFSSHIHSGSDITGGTIEAQRIDASIARGSEIMPTVLASDGMGSGLNADMVDNLHAAALQNRVTGTCNGQVMVSINSNGTVNCEADDTGGGSLWSQIGSNINFNSGNVGIGLTNPNRKLYVVEDVSGVAYPLKLDNPHPTFNQDAVGILFSTGGSGGGPINTDRGKGALVYEYTSTWNRGDFHFLQETGTNATNPVLSDAVMTIKSSGNVGIGTPEPGAALEIANTFSPQINLSGSANTGANASGYKLYISGYDNDDTAYTYPIFVVDENNGVDFWLKSRSHAAGTSMAYFHGKVGIGETDPVAKLEVVDISGKAIHGKSATSEKGDPGYGVYGENVTSGKFGYLGGEDYAVYGNGNVKFENGTVSVPILEITGGADLSEQFEIHTRESELIASPGMVVSIDPENPGHLVVSNKAYDRKVAGIISGAGGVNAGMLMGQKGSEADGSSPVALTGRVYCRSDASYGSIEPGDLLTTSDTQGHAMKVNDYDSAQGAILGKAMTSLDQGRGLVLVLVTLQ
jgi:hypothetical protein